MSSIITGMTTQALVLRNRVVDVMAQVDPGVDPGVEFNYAAPWLGAFRSIAGMIGATVVVAVAIGGFVSVGFIVFGKFSKSEQAFSKGMSGLLWTLAGAAILGSIAGLIGWAAGLPLVPAPEPQPAE